MEFMRTLTRPRPLVAGVPAAGAFIYSGAALTIGLLVLFALNAGLHFPGSQNEDSLQQYQQALLREYQDWHPPVMAWLWAQLLRLAPGPAPMLLLQLAAYWLGFGLLADGLRRTGQPRLAWVVALIGAFPPFLTLNALIVKDVGLVASWVAAVGIVFWFRVQSRRLPLWAGAAAALFLLYGTLVRTNAIFGLGPLLLLLAWRAHRLQWKTLVVAAVVTAPLMLPVSQWINRDVLGARNNEAVQSLFLFDLLGIARHTGQPGVLEPRATLSQADLQACYTPYWWDSLAPWGRCGGKIHKAADPKIITSPEGLSKQWLSAIAANPVAYAKHRLKHFNSALMFVVPLKHVRFVPEYQPADASFKPFGVITPQEVRWDLVRKSPLVWPVSWVAWGVVLLVFLARRREDTGMSAGTARVLTVSALGYALAYLLVGVSTDVRYHYWAMLALLVATVLVLPQLAQGWRERDRSLRVGLGALGAVVAVGIAARLFDFQAFM